MRNIVINVLEHLFDLFYDDIVPVVPDRRRSADVGGYFFHQQHPPSDEDSSTETETEEDEEEEEGSRTVIEVRPRPLNLPAAAARHFSADDRPITPMKNTMIYNTQTSSLDFEDGIIDSSHFLS